jgi:Galactose oxidase, central domain
MSPHRKQRLNQAFFEFTAPSTHATHATLEETTFTTVTMTKMRIDSSRSLFVVQGFSHFAKQRVVSSSSSSSSHLLLHTRYFTTPAAMKLTWTKLNLQDDPEFGRPCERSSHGLSIVKNESVLVLYGGEKVARTPIDAASGALWLADLQTKTWKKVNVTTGAAPPERVGHAQAAHGDQTIYIFGGRSGITMHEAAMNDMWAFDVETETWKQVIASNEDGGAALPEARSFHRMICVGDSLYVFGGCGAKSGRLADMHRFDIQTNTWHNLGASTLLRGRGGPNLLSLDSGKKLGVVAGFAGEETNDGQRFDVVQGKWEDKLLCPTAELQGLRPRSVCTSASFPSLGVAIVFGGEVDPSHKGHEGAGGFENDVVVLDEKTGEYKETIPAGEGWPGKRGWSDAAAYEDGTSSSARFYIYGGLAGDDTNPVRLSDLWSLTLTK